MDVEFEETDKKVCEVVGQSIQGCKDEDERVYGIKRLVHNLITHLPHFDILDDEGAMFHVAPGR